jgi:hypothetical protein
LFSGTFSAAVFPPVLGPVMITVRFSGGTQMSTGTYEQHAVVIS